MEGIEKAIRNAFAKADAANPAIRQRIYESAWAAQERTLVENASLSEDQRSDRRERLKNTIMRIENEFRPASAPEPVAPPKAARVEPSASIPDASARPAPSDALRGQRSEPDLGSLDVAPREPARQPAAAEARPTARPVQAKKRSGGLRKLFVTVGLLAILGGAGYVFATSTDWLSTPRSGQTSSSGVPVVGAPLKEGETASDVNWITVFDPANPTQIATSGKATAEIATKDGRPVVRLKSPGEKDQITFDVGQGVIEKLAGKLAVFDILAESDDGQLTQMSVSCDFGTQGDCGRKRYDVTDAQNEYLFEVNFADGAAGAGKITLNTDISGKGKAIDVHAIRVSVAP